MNMNISNKEIQGPVDVNNIKIFQHEHNLMANSIYHFP